VKFLAENNQQTRVLNYTEQQSYLAKATPVLRDVAIHQTKAMERLEQFNALQQIGEFERHEGRPQ
jgi:hypothetical protein